VLTVDCARLGVGPGLRVLDLGCGQGRHAFAAYRLGASVVAVDRSDAECKDTAAMLGAMRLVGEAGEVGEVGAATGGGACASGVAVCGDGLALPFADATFDLAVAAEVLEHVADDRAAMAELARVLRPGGRLAVTVPRWFPERVCWALADDYHAPAVPGGHVRVYRRRQLAARLRGAGLVLWGSHHAHALHSPYWWLRCAVGVANDRAWPVRQYHRFLVWDIGRCHPAVRLLERTLDPVIGKSLVLYLEKPAAC
jgi:SAM-dependent methyltransferase